MSRFIPHAYFAICLFTLAWLVYHDLGAPTWKLLFVLIPLDVVMAGGWIFYWPMHLIFGV